MNNNYNNITNSLQFNIQEYSSVYFNDKSLQQDNQGKLQVIEEQLEILPQHIHNDPILTKGVLVQYDNGTYIDQDENNNDHTDHYNKFSKITPEYINQNYNDDDETEQIEDDMVLIRKNGQVKFQHHPGVISIGTGTLDGFTLSINDLDNTHFDIGAGKGSVNIEYMGQQRVFNVSLPENIDITIQDPCPAQPGGTPVSYKNTRVVTYISIDKDGNVYPSANKPNNESERSYIYLGLVVHTDLATGIITSVSNQAVPILHVSNQLYDIANAIGFMNIGGNQFSQSSTGNGMYIQKTYGKIYAFGVNFNVNHNDPSNVEMPATDTFLSDRFQYRMYNGTSSDLNQQVINPNILDNGTNYPGIAVNNNKWTAQRILMYSTGQINIQPGQFEYQNMLEARNGILTESFIRHPQSLENALLIGYIVVQQGETDLSNALFLAANKFGQGAGQSSEQLDISGKLNIDGTIAMTGNLDMGTNNIVNVNLVDGIDVSALNTNVQNNISSITGLANDISDLQTGKLSIDGTIAMNGNLDMGLNNIINVGTVDGVDVSNLWTQAQNNTSSITGLANDISDLQTGKLNIDGTNFMTGNLDLGNNTVVNLQANSLNVNSLNLGTNNYFLTSNGINNIWKQYITNDNIEQLSLGISKIDNQGTASQIMISNGLSNFWGKVTDVLMDNNTISINKLSLGTNNYFLTSDGLTNIWKQYISNDNIENGTLNVLKLSNGGLTDKILSINGTGTIEWKDESGIVSGTAGQLYQMLDGTTQGWSKLTNDNVNNNTLQASKLLNQTAYNILQAGSDGVITSGKLNNSSINDNTISIGRLQVQNGNPNTVLAFNGSGTPVTDKIDDNYIDDGTINGGKITNYTVGLSKIVNYGSVNADKVLYINSTGYVTYAKLPVDCITNYTIPLGKILRYSASSQINRVLYINSSGYTSMAKVTDTFIDNNSISQSKIIGLSGHTHDRINYSSSNYIRSSANSSYSYQYFYNNSTLICYYYYYLPSNYITFRQNESGSYIMRFNYNGSTKSQVWWDGDYTVSSDKRVKKNIRACDAKTKAFMNIKFYDYEYIQDEKDEKEGIENKPCTGILAQELLDCPCYKECIYEHKDDENEKEEEKENNKDPKNKLFISTTKFMMKSFHCVQQQLKEQMKINEQQEEKIIQMEKRMKNMEKMLEMIKQ